MLQLALVGLGVRGREGARVVREETRVTAAYVDLDLQALHEWVEDVGDEAVPCFEHLDRTLAATQRDGLIVAMPPGFGFDTWKPP